ncbi:hypothetical protein GCM10027445_64560 [Amycolatopsis endophytica]|uniref:DNA-binding CsgD family transcriptional regulator n=1 Tax=Amycolatopsis endophytica TaxID=860233 RepID=A0A853B4Z5_9PSEU|nr:LuxR C-terminal-related transcriptional regulator [Amycolatopsis endophytica]NYI89844.1 DNA-binding CsgD family transcriptional regulator [Amycolatopsis endophytica]
MITHAHQAPPRLSVLNGHSTGPLVSRHARVTTKLAAARREVLVFSSLSGGPGDPFRPVDVANLARGVRYRVLVPDAARTRPGPARQLVKLAQAGAEVRTMPAVPVEALIVDGALAIVPAEDRGRQADIAVLRLPAVVATFLELADRLWPAAVPLVPTDSPVTSELAGRDRELLSLLSAGCTDESAAAALGVSVRTVRRMVSSLMNRLGARSRFQAGVKAAGHGWLAGKAS